MNYSPSIHPLSLLAKSIAGNLFALFGDMRYPKTELLVLNYHSTPKKLQEEFNRQIVFLKSRYNIISPQELDLYYSGKLNSDRCSLLLTFDDGLKNNLIAAEILERHGLRGYFFLVPGYMEAPAGEQKNYYIKNIRPLINEAIDHEPEDFTCMEVGEVRQLKEKGHAIGCHTYSHTIVAANSDTVNSYHEIVESKKALCNLADTTIESFCSINNTLESVGRKEKVLISEHYKFHFTTLPGSNETDRDPLFIKRRNVECHWPLGAMKYAMGKSDLKRWTAKIAAYDSL